MLDGRQQHDERRQPEAVRSTRRGVSHWLRRLEAKQAGKGDGERLGVWRAPTDQAGPRAIPKKRRIAGQPLSATVAGVATAAWVHGNEIRV